MCGDYKIISKLGWGHFSTVWKVVNTKRNPDKFYALKIMKSNEKYAEAAHDEIEVLKLITKNDPQNNNFCTHIIDSFTIKGPNGIRKYSQSIIQSKKNSIIQFFVYILFLYFDIFVFLYFDIFVFLDPCMVFEVLGSNLLDLIKVYHYRGFSIPAVKFITYQVLVALDFLHAKNRLIHTDLKPENVFMYNKVSPELYTDILEQDKKKKKAELPKKESPPPPPPPPPSSSSSTTTKTDKKEGEEKQKSENKPIEETKSENKPIEESKGINKPIEETKGDDKSTTTTTEKPSEEPKGDDKTTTTITEKPVEDDKQPVFPPLMYKGVNLSLYRVKLGDFGNAAWVDKRYGDDIQTREYRCPEVILGSPWGTPVDIWSLGCMVFELLTGDFLFNPKTGQGYSKEDDHLAQIVELLGDIPRKVKFSGVDSRKFFNNDGSFRRIRKDDIRFWGLKDVLREKYKFTAAESKSIAAFINDTLIYDPYQRKNARQLLNHPWLAEIANFLKTHPLPSN